MDLEEEIGRLFGLPPEEFIAARDQLARQLKAGGDASGAKRISALRRPTVAAWAVNQAARERPELVRELLEAGDRLHQAQRRALSGLRGGGLRDAGAQRRAAVDRLAAVAAEALERSGRSPDPHRDAISSTLQAASVDGEAAAALRAGTLSKELAVSSGFGEAGGLALVRPLPAEPAEPEEPEARPAEPAERRGRGGRGGTAAPSRRRAGEGGAAGTTARKDGRATAARRRELEAARRRLEALRRQADKAEQTAARTREAADQAAEAEDAAATEAQRLAEGARQARQAAEAARRAAEQARIAADDARQEADAAKTRSQRAARKARAADGEAAEADDAARTARRELERAERQLADLEPAD